MSFKAPSTILPICIEIVYYEDRIEYTVQRRDTWATIEEGNVTDDEMDALTKRLTEQYPHSSTIIHGRHIAPNILLPPPARYIPGRY